MKNTSMMVMIGLVVVVGGITAYSLMSRTAPSSSPTSSSPAQPSSMEQKESVGGEKDLVQTEGRYAPFSPELLASTASTRRVLFFYANWCPTCKPADKSFSDNSVQIPEDVTVIRVNYNDTETDQDEKELAKKYNVTYQHTFVQIDAQGNEVTKWNGGQIEELLSNLK